jgi:hypothetical protein
MPNGPNSGNNEIEEEAKKLKQLRKGSRGEE